MEDRPRLPPEILEQIVWQLERPCFLGDSVAQSTLSSLSLVSKVVRHWALTVKYSVVIAPRHVRDFRKWYRKSNQEMIGYNQALFVALDDVSKMTSASAGWESDLQRLLQRLGPKLTQLSLWTSETRAVLRDPAQVRGPRFRNNMSIHTLEDVIASTLKRRHKLERRSRKMKQGEWVDPNLKPLKVEKDQDEQKTKAEIVAARERARQKIPNWLQRELETKKEEEVKRIYRAHIGTTVREYQHELDAVKECRPSELEEDKLMTVSNSSFSSLLDEDDFHGESSSSSSSDSDDDHDVDWGCLPIKLSICPSLPLHEHENVLNFARMTIWTRVEELDVYIAVPIEVSKYLQLFSSLVASPIVKFRISSIHASLIIIIQSESKEGRSSTVNMARGLGQILASEVLSSLLLHEFSNNHMEDVSILERAIKSAFKSDNTLFDDKLRKKGGLAASLDCNTDNNNRVQIRILQGNQSHWGKLKDRKQDFLNRTLNLGEDNWDTMIK